MPKAPKGYYPASAIWEAIINTLKNDSYIGVQIANQRTSEKTIYRLPLTDINVLDNKNKKVISVWFKNEVAFNRGDCLESATYKFYIDIQTQDAEKDVAVQMAYEFAEDIKFTLMSNGNLSNTSQRLAVNEFEPVENPRTEGKLWTFIGCMLLEIETGYQYL